MIPLSEASIKGKEKFALFKNSSFFTVRTEELNRFCIVNKRIINKLIKSKPAQFANELDELIKHMPNLLDFDNKRIYFKKELARLKKN
jgi:5-bromo-4-chloroindolyl phosphate hydrolysis protein